MWGEEKQSHYTEGRNIKEINKDMVDSYCACGYITLKPSNQFESYNGGLTVKRKDLTILNKNGGIVIRLKIKQKDFIKVWSCNACVNDWK